MYWDAIPQVSTSNFTTTSASLVDVTGLTFAAVASSVYEVQVVLKVQGSDTNGLQFAVACSAAGSTGEFLCISHTTTASTTLTYSSNAIGTANAVNQITTANADGIVTLYSIVTTVGSAGNITTKCLKSTAGTATIYVGSVMKIKKLA